MKELKEIAEDAKRVIRIFNDFKYACGHYQDLAGSFCNQQGTYCLVDACPYFKE